MNRFRHIVVATDFGPSSERAVAMAIDLARAFDGQLTIVHTYEIPSYAYTGMGFGVTDMLSPVEAAAAQQLEATMEEVRKALPRAQSILRRGVPWEEVLAAAEKAGADLLVVGTHGRRGVSHALLGSVAEKVVRMSPIPVLTVRGEERRA